MPQPRVTELVSLMVALLSLGSSLHAASAQDSLKVIDNPGGGQVVYGAAEQDTAPHGDGRGAALRTHPFRRCSCGRQGVPVARRSKFRCLFYRHGESPGQQKNCRSRHRLARTRQKAGRGSAVRRIQPLRKDRADVAARADRGMEECVCAGGANCRRGCRSCSSAHSHPIPRWQRRGQPASRLAHHASHRMAPRRSQVRAGKRCC